jgi:hypothetical protein
MLEYTDWRTCNSRPDKSGRYSLVFWPGTNPQDAEDASGPPSHSATTEPSSTAVTRQTVGSLLVELFKAVPEVESICAKFEADGATTIWTLLKTYDRDARDRVYDKELEVCEQLRLCDFDFRVTSVDLVDSDELVATGAREIFRRSP